MVPIGDPLDLSGSRSPSSVVRPAQLHAAARMSSALVYTVGIAGVVAGSVLWRQGEVPFAIVAWALTFVAGAALQLIAWLTRGVAQLLERSEQLGDELRAMRADKVAEERGDADDPYGRGRWGWH